MEPKKSLTDELKDLLNPEPSIEDPENENDSDTLATRLYDVDLNSADQLEIASFSKIRKKQVSFLDSSNNRYAGKKVSRKDIDDLDLYDEDGEEIIEDEADDDSFDEDEEEDDDDDDIEDENGEDEEKEEEFRELVQSSRGLDENHEEFIDILQDNKEELVTKANSVKNQMIIFEHLIDLRIKMQKLLAVSNKFPKKNCLEKIKQTDSTWLLNKLLAESTKGMRKLNKVLYQIDSFASCTKEDKLTELSEGNKRKLANDINDEILSKRFCTIREDYRETIDKWHERTRFVHGNVNLKKFAQFDVCPSKLIDQVLVDKERLITRTRTKRSEYKVLGEDEEREYDTDIFDDDDFYHALLKQVIDSKLSQTEDSLSVSNKFTSIQRMRNKMKKKVDTKASKGRRIRYDVHEKLVNFMAPIDTTTMPDEARNELFKSLFGTLNSIPIE